MLCFIVFALFTFTSSITIRCDRVVNINSSALTLKLFTHQYEVCIEVTTCNPLPLPETYNAGGEAVWVVTRNCSSSTPPPTHPPPLQRDDMDQFVQDLLTIIRPMLYFTNAAICFVIVLHLLKYVLPLLKHLLKWLCPPPPTREAPDALL